MRKVLGSSVVLVVASLACAQAATSQPTTKPVAEYSVRSVGEQLQDVSVTIKTRRGEGSGVLIRRGEWNYVLTAAHVVDSLRSTREVVDTKGGKRTVVEFGTAEVVQKLVQDGRIVGTLSIEAVVVTFSDSDTGEDLALLKIRKRRFSEASASFYLDERIPSVGTDLYHVGSLLGETGSNSLTTGILSQIGRVLDDKVYDQTSCTAFPGSSGGGVYLKDTGEYVGMLTRGAGETFNLIVPVRRITIWAKRVGVSFVLNPDLEVPSDADLKKIPIEDVK